MIRITAFIFIAAFALPAAAVDFPPLAPELKALDVQSGHWVYQGTTASEKPGAKPGTFTWDEHCGWSANQLFLMCSFDNDWSGDKVQSLVVDTWNSKDKAYWHYEMFAVGVGGAKPFASKINIQGKTWTELGEDDDKGKKSYDRITYKYSSPTSVTVTIEVSKDQKTWKTILQGTGTKQL